MMSYSSGGIGQVITLDYYPYAGIEYRGYPDMSFPPGSSYGDIGKYHFIYFIFLCFSKRIKKKNIFGWYQVLKITLLHRCGSAMTRRIPTTSPKESGI
jgi:hypothetical protein